MLSSEICSFGQHLFKMNNHWVREISWKNWTLLIFILNFIGAQLLFSQGNSKDSPIDDSLFFNLNQNLEKWGLNSPLEQAKASAELGRFYQKHALPSKAIEYFGNALELIHDLPADTLQAQLNNSIAEIHLEANNYDLAMGFVEEALELSERLGNIKHQALANGTLGECMEKQGEYGQALELQKKSLSFYQALGDKLGMAKAHEDIGSIYEDLTQYDLALSYFQKAYAYSKNKENEFHADILNNIGDVFRKQGNFEEGLRYTKMAKSLSIKIRSHKQLASAYKDLAKTYALMGEHEKAFQNLMEAESYRELLAEETNKNQLGLWQAIYESHQQENQIQLLKEKNKVTLANQKLMAIAFLSIALLAFFGYKYKRRKVIDQRRLEELESRTLKAELERKAAEEKVLQKENQTKTTALSQYSLQLSQKNKLLFELSRKLKNMANRKEMDLAFQLKHLSKEVDFHLEQENEWEEFMGFFQEIHPGFSKKLSETANSKLSPAELKLAALLRMNLSSKEMASILRITPDSVRVARYRLRKKLPIEAKKDLVNFMIEM